MKGHMWSIESYICSSETVYAYEQVIFYTSSSKLNYSLLLCFLCHAL